MKPKKCGTKAKNVVSLKRYIISELRRNSGTWKYIFQLANFTYCPLFLLCPQRGGDLPLEKVQLTALKLCGDEVAEWLRRWTANPLGSARVGSNPIFVASPHWFYGVMVSTLDFESSDPSSNLGRTWYLTLSNLTINIPWKIPKLEICIRYTIEQMCKKVIMKFQLEGNTMLGLGIPHFAFKLRVIGLFRK